MLNLHCSKEAPILKLTWRLKDKSVAFRDQTDMEQNLTFPKVQSLPRVLSITEFMMKCTA